MTATVARIRRCNRESEFAVAQSLSVLAARPDARPVGDESFVIDSFFDVTAHAQFMLNERFAIQSAARRAESAESAEPLRLGTDIALAPVLPKARMVDTSRNLNRAMPIAGISVDLQTDRNSIETVG